MNQFPKPPAIPIPTNNQNVANIPNNNVFLNRPMVPNQLPSNNQISKPPMAPPPIPGNFKSPIVRQQINQSMNNNKHFGPPNTNTTNLQTSSSNNRNDYIVADKNTYNVQNVIDDASAINYSDDQYISDLKTLEEFYEKNKFSPILTKQYSDYELDWIPPQVTLPIDELYARLKYYDDVLTYQKLSNAQIALIKERIEIIINQLCSYDEFWYYKKFGFDKLTYNDYFEDQTFKNIHYYQREDDIDSWGPEKDFVPVSIPKDKWWIFHDFYADEASNFVNFIDGKIYPSQIMEHPMFTYLDEYGSFNNFSHEPIIMPSDTTSYSDISENLQKQEANQPQQKQVLTKKKHWWNSFKLNKKEKINEGEKQNMSIEKTNFPKKQNPTPPQPTQMPPKQNPTPPQPTQMPPKQNPTPPKPGFSSNIENPTFFNYQTQSLK